MLTEGVQYAQDTTRVVTAFVHQTATPFEVFSGTATSPLDITRFVTSAKQSANEATLGLAWHDEIYGADQPRSGQVLEIKLDGVQFWVGVIQAVNDYRLSSGEKSMSITSRSRDATPIFRDTRRATQIYPTATPLSYIARQVAQSCGLQAAEIQLTDTGASTVHSNTQLADLTPWQMLTTLYQPSGMEPYVDVRGRLKCISRDVSRMSDVVLDDNRRLVSVQGSKSQPPLTEMRIKWLDPNLSEVAQVPKVLSSKTLTAGFFQLRQQQDVSFSTDQTQRARDTYLVVRQSANSGLLPVCTESWEQTTTTGGKLTLETSAWVPGLATAAMAVKFTAHNWPDIVAYAVTEPVGRRLEFAADAVLFLTMMSIGTGMYEIWGTPYDYVHARNTTTAYNEAAGVWELKPFEIENDFVMNADQAQSFAIRELSHQYRSSFSYSAVIVDDTRVERGDIIELSDGSRLYVTDYSRDLSHGAAALLNVHGFRV